MAIDYNLIETIHQTSRCKSQIGLPYVNSGKYQTAVEVFQVGVKLLQREEIADDSIALVRFRHQH